MSTERLSATCRRWLASGAAGSVEILAAFLLVAALMCSVEFAGPAIIDNDGYYHIRWSRILRDSLPKLPRFESLPLTTLNADDYADHHFLFHALLTVFTAGDLRIGAKIAAVAFSSVGIASLFALLVVYRVPFRWLWLAPLAASSAPFLYRMSMTRAPALSLLMLGAGCYLIFERRPVLLALLSFAFAWSYSLFPLIIIFSIAFAVSVYLAERRAELGSVGASIIGAIAGLVFNPYFPNNIVLLLKHILMKVKSDYDVPVGLEWYPYESWGMLQGSIVAFAVFALGLVLFSPVRKPNSTKPLFFLFVSIILLLALFKSRRFVEYWPPFAILFSAFAVNLDPLRSACTGFKRAVMIGGALVVLGIPMAMNVYSAAESVKDEPNPLAYQGAAEWLAMNTSPGAMVFNTDWDDYPMLFYYNTHNRFVAGLDPTYLYERDPELWQQYERVTLGKEPDSAAIITDRFGAGYVFTDNSHEAFLDLAFGSGNFKTVYSDRDATVLQVVVAGKH